MLIHNYFGVDYAMLWNIVEVFLPDLKKKIMLIANDLEDQPKT